LRRESEHIKTEIDKLNDSIELKKKEAAEMEKQVAEALQRETQLEESCNQAHKRIFQKLVSR